jgi:hypothetical protein
LRQEGWSLGSGGDEIAIPAKVQDLVDALDLQGDCAACYLDLDTGEVHVIAHEAFAIAEEGAGAHPLDCEEEEVALAQRILARIVPRSVVYKSGSGEVPISVIDDR